MTHRPGSTPSPTSRLPHSARRFRTGPSAPLFDLAVTLPRLAAGVFSVTLPRLAAVLFSLALMASACSSQRGTIGAVIGQSSDRKLTVREVPKGLAADKAGLQPGDEILLINGIDVRTLDDRHVQQLLTGEVDEKVKLTIVRGDQVLRVEVRRTRARHYRPER